MDFIEICTRSSWLAKNIADNDKQAFCFSIQIHTDDAWTNSYLFSFVTANTIARSQLMAIVNELFAIGEFVRQLVVFTRARGRFYKKRDDRVWICNDIC